jgi:hypothetical protein
MPESLQWWQADVRRELSQGDVLGSVPFTIPKWPTVYLKHTDMRGGASGWAEATKPALNRADQKTYVLAAYSNLPGLVISHDCEIDKPSSTRILVAPVAAMSTLDEKTRQLVVKQRLFAMMALPSIPGSVDSYADLRLIGAVSRDAVDVSPRLASMTDAARSLLHARLVGFLLDRKLPVEDAPV